jgi:glutathione synthase/RimK-type ligase-like ATP-grasp enzyme
MRIAMLVPAPDYPEPWAWAFDVQADALRTHGAVVEAVRWTEFERASGFDLILPLVAWGYHLRYERWLAFLDRAQAQHWPMFNPASLLRWNSDKSYLVELGAAGVPTVPTLAVAQLCDGDLDEARHRFDCDWLVIKPPVSASATGTYRLGRNDDLPPGSLGRPMIVQPLIEAVATEGEYSLMLFEGEFSHAVIKQPKVGDFRVQEQYGGSTHPCPPPPGGIALARQALAAGPVKATYARVDIVHDGAGNLLIMELELIEPALFLDGAPDGGAAFANAVLSLATAGRE